MKRNRLYAFGLLVISIVSAIASQTYISGDISKFKLDATNNPFIVEKNIEVPTGKKVVIGEGCVFLFKIFTGFNIRGSISVDGTREHPVIFTSINDTAYNSPTGQIAEEFEWNGINIEQDAEDVIFNYFQLSYSVYGIKSSKNDIIINNRLFKSNEDARYALFEKTINIQNDNARSKPATNEVSEIKNSKDDQTSLYITTNPAGAEVYLDKKPGKRISPDFKTPGTIDHFKNPNVNVTLFKKGYADTTISFNILPGKSKNIDISLKKISPETAGAQKRLLKDRTHVKIGRVCIYTSPIFIAGGAGLIYLSEKNRQKAEDARDYLDKTIVRSGQTYDDMVQQFDDESNSRDLKFFSGIALFGLAAIDLGGGLILFF